MKQNTKTSVMTRIILFISILFMLTSCVQEKHKLYKTDNGYCYQDDNLIWHIFIYNTLTDTYYETETSTAPSYDSSTTYSSSDVGISTEMAEATGEDTGGTDSENDVDGSGMSESEGSDTGGSDSSGDSGGSDGGGDSGGGE